MKIYFEFVEPGKPVEVTEPFYLWHRDHGWLYRVWRVEENTTTSREDASIEAEREPSCAKGCGGRACPPQREARRRKRESAGGTARKSTEAAKRGGAAPGAAGDFKGERVFGWFAVTRLPADAGMLHFMGWGSFSAAEMRAAMKKGIALMQGALSQIYTVADSPGPMDRLLPHFGFKVVDRYTRGSDHLAVWKHFLVEKTML